MHLLIALLQRRCAVLVDFPDWSSTPCLTITHADDANPNANASPRALHAVGLHPGPYNRWLLHIRQSPGDGTRRNLQKQIMCLCIFSARSKVDLSQKWIKPTIVVFFNNYTNHCSLYYNMRQLSTLYICQRSVICAYPPTPVCIYMNRYGRLSSQVNWCRSPYILGVKLPSVDICISTFYWYNFHIKIKVN